MGLSAVENKIDVKRLREIQERRAILHEMHSRILDECNKVTNELDRLRDEEYRIRYGNEPE